MLSRAMDTELVRVWADELAFLAARLNRRAGELEAMDPESEEFRDAVLVAGFLTREIAVALGNLRAHVVLAGERVH